MSAYTGLTERLSQDSRTVAAVAGALVLLYVLAGVCYRLYFHPLAKFPGPKSAALTVWYEFYWDCIKKGKYTFEIGRMHEEYGPIVRIGPEEIHVNDPSFIDECYAGGSKKRNKVDTYGPQLGTPDSLFGTADHNLHRMRRSALNQFFSKASVVKLEPIIRDVAQKLCQQLEGYTGTGKPVVLSKAMSCVTADVVTEYAFARSYNLLDSSTFEPNLHAAIVAGTNMAPIIRRFPWILTLMKSLPDSVVKRLNPEMDIYLKFQNDMRTQVDDIRFNRNTSHKSARTHATIFHELLHGSLSEYEKRSERLGQEGQNVIGAGTETTAWTLTVGMYYILENPAVLTKLRTELMKLTDNNKTGLPSWNALEKLPYLTGCIQESLRLSFGLSTRLFRINPDGPMVYRPTDRSKPEWIIPQGTAVGMTSTLVHLNPELFPDPLSFEPERWIDANGDIDRTLSRYMLTFSKGSRQCIGINLAYAELYITVAVMILEFGDRFELFETTREDVEIQHDLMVPFPKMGSKGVRVVINELKEAKM